MYSFNIYSLISLFVAEIYLILAVYIFFRNPKGGANRLFLLVGASMALWGIGEGMERAATDPATAIFWVRYIIGIGSAFHPAFLLNFWLVFSGQISKIKKKLIIPILYIPSMIFLVMRLFYPALLVKGVTQEYWGYSTEGTTLYLFYMLYLVVYTSIVVYFAFRTYFQAQGKLKSQARNIGLGILFVLFVGIATQALRPILPIQVPELTTVSSIIFITLIAYSVNKYGMLVISTKLAAENIIETMEDYVVVIDKNMNIVIVNNSVDNNLDYKEGELMNKPINALLSADISSLTSEQLLKRFPLVNYRANLITKNGDKISVTANGSVLKEERNEIAGFVFVMRDMRQMTELISKLEQKTKELETSKKDIEKSKKELEMRNQELERFNKLAVGRELAMIELKKKLKETEVKTQKSKQSDENT
jgi:PAS domain S-box-containing protein